MLHLLDEALENFLRAAVPALARNEVDVSFAAPDGDWAARLSKPTVDLYLWDVRRNTEEREGGREAVVGEDGRRRFRSPLPRVDCRYLVTAWGSEASDEHSLLGDTLTALLLHSALDPVHLPGRYANVRPHPALEVGVSAGTDNADFWSALGGQLKPGLDLVVTATVDAALVVDTGKPVDRYTIRTTANGHEAGERLLVAGRSNEPEGTWVATRRGSARTAADGTFLLPAEPGDEVSVDGVVRGVVPETGVIDLTD